MPPTTATQPLLMLDLEGLTVSQEEQELLRHPATGGVILFSRNYQEPRQLHQLVRALRAVRADLLIAVDQEGGRVQRFKNGFTRLPPMAALGRFFERDQESALHAADLLGELMADEIRAFDIDISFAPVLDLDHGRSTVIGDRSFHGDIGAVMLLAAAFIDGMGRAGMSATGKHFPGHGHVAADSHLELPEDPRSWDALQDDMAPFLALASRLDGIMPAHVRYPAVAPEPAGFSAHWLRGVLRGYCAYRGVIFSDDLAMAGAAVAGDYPQRAEAALNAGCDMVLVCNDRAAAVAVLEWLEGRHFDARVPVTALRGRPRAPISDNRRRRAGEVVHFLMKESS